MVLMRRRSRRRVVLAVLIGATMAGLACGRRAGEAGRFGCAACAIVGVGVESATRRELRARALESACGDCRGDRVCNHLYDPPRCVARRAPEGGRCGSFETIAYACDEGLRCAPENGQMVCVSLPREGEACDHESTFAGCARGLTCAGDDRCRRLCPECPQATRCNPLDDPPQCRPNLLPDGARCGRLARGAVDAWAESFLCANVCVERSGVARCEPSQRGRACGQGTCPEGMRCDHMVCKAGP